MYHGAGVKIGLLTFGSSKPSSHIKYGNADYVIRRSGVRITLGALLNQGVTGFTCFPFLFYARFRLTRAQRSERFQLTEWKEPNFLPGHGYSATLVPGDFWLEFRQFQSYLEGI